MWQLDSNEHRSLICRFCGGPTCKREDWTKQPDYETSAAIRGLHSSFVLPTVIGMQRPSSRLIALHGIAGQLVTLGVAAIINLQVAGEHALCGDGIHAHGFSYSPEELLPCHHYAFGWVDMGVPSIERMMNVVQVIEMHERRGEKVAVHCHAGYGRTGMVIACFLVFSHHYSADVAIATVRARREGSVQTREQKRFVHRFERFVKYVRCHYHTIHQPEPQHHSTPPPPHAPHPSHLRSPGAVPPPTAPATSSPTLPPLSPTPALPPSLSYTPGPMSLSTLLAHQRTFLHGAERAQYRYVSKLVTVLTAALSSSPDSLIDELTARAQGGARDLSSPPHARFHRRQSFLHHLPFDFSATWTLEDTSTLERVKHGANLNDYAKVESASPFIVLLALLHFLSALSTPLLPYLALSSTLPTSLSLSFAHIPKPHLPTMHAVLSWPQGAP